MSNFYKSHRITIIFLVMVSVLGVATYFIVSQLRDKGTFEKATRGNIIEAIYGIGTIKSDRTFTAKIAIPTVLKKLHVIEGQSINATEPLFDIDTPKRFTAPFSGVVTSIFLKEGESIFPQTPVLTLTDFSKRYLLVSIEQQGLLKARVGQTAQISFESIRNQRFEGTVTLIYSNPNGFFLRIDVPDLPAFLLPEMTADVAIKVRTHENMLLVPVSAISLGSIFVKKSDLDPGKKVPVTVGLIDGKMAQIIEGEVVEGDLVRVDEEK